MARHSKPRQGTRKKWMDWFTPNRCVVCAFWCGWAASTNFRGLLQDLMGMEAYIQSVRENWMDSSITGPIHLFLLGLALILYSSLKKETTYQMGKMAMSIRELMSQADDLATKVRSLVHELWAEKMRRAKADD